ncbi:MAG: YceI family protein [Prolixibacteraceae bacterium]|jgi:hypothetical protein|nr:YceI family protein [Prolixibacteraceae bacterium]
MMKQFKYILVAFLILPEVIKAVVPEIPCGVSAYLFDQIIITGATNVNEFQLSYRENTFTRLNGSSDVKNNNLQICIPVRNIEAESQLMLDDFLNIVNADMHPEISISMSAQPTEFLQPGNSVIHRISLSMNGKTNVYTCKSDVLFCQPDGLSMEGRLDVRLTDFGIDPPRKFLGIVKVKNEVFINFRVLFSTGQKEPKIEIQH